MGNAMLPIGWLESCRKGANMPRVTISSSSSIPPPFCTGWGGPQVFMPHGDMALVPGTDHTQLVVVLLDVVGCGGSIPTILTTPRAKTWVFYHPSLVCTLGLGIVDLLDSHNFAQQPLPMRVKMDEGKPCCLGLMPQFVKTRVFWHVWSHQEDVQDIGLLQDLHQNGCAVPFLVHEALWFNFECLEEPLASVWPRMNPGPTGASEWCNQLYHPPSPRFST